MGSHVTARFFPGIHQDQFSCFLEVFRLEEINPAEAAQSAPLTDVEQIESYVSSSIKKNAFVRVIQDVETFSDTANEHPLALLAEQTEKLLKKDSVHNPLNPAASQC